ncbi:sex comb on midleg-like protein 1 isoform X2 [Nycticebus coucang]|uniref:sex comb on midleg-like protein 1 isoform X2 n=1 Tax=Nycticebus coucang TaxID=9470 RepID=UPI00234DF8CE|nr:sex comb on midleg-like protein 1 isoform X2 [Nycticebus coucang]
MSSGSSDVDVQENVLSENEEPAKTVVDVIKRCQTIEETLQNLSKKCDQILGKVSKIYRCRVKSLWQARKPFGYAYKNYNYLKARKLKFQRRRRRRRGLSESFSHPESYSPTFPAERRGNNLSIHVETPYNSEDSQGLGLQSPFREQTIREHVLEQTINPNPSIFQHSYQSYFPVDEGMRAIDTSAPYPSPGPHSTSTNLSPTRPSSAIHTSMLSSEDGCLTQNTSCLSQVSGCLTQNTSCLTLNTSCLAPNTSCLTPNTSCLAPNTSCLAPNTSCLTPNTSYLTPNTSYLTPNTSCLAQSSGCLTQKPKMISYASLMEDKHCGSPLRVPCGFATSSPLPHDHDRLKPIFSVDPSTWSVEDVVTFLKQTDAPMSNLLTDLFRHHDIDGKALLLLKSDMMMQYMGLKLGTAVKLCHYIERLKEQKYYDI